MRESQSGRQHGSISVIVAVALIPVLVMFAAVVDVARVWTDRVTLQNGVEAAAVAVASSWTSGLQECRASDLTLVSRNGATPQSVNCSVTGTSGRGVVRVSASGDVNLMFASLIGRNSAGINASTGVLVGPASSAFGLRPFALCDNHPAVLAWLGSNFTSTTTETVTFESNGTACGGPAPGNWGVLDFNGGSNSTSETERWVSNGFDDEVTVGDVIPGNPGAPSSSLKVSGIVGKRVVVPLFGSVTLQGSHAMYTITGFAEVYVVGITLNGPSNKRAIMLRFERGSMRGTVGSVFATNFGLSSWQICSYDSHGACS